MATDGPGYNPYRDADGKFSRPEDVGQKIDDDLQAAKDAGDSQQVHAIEDYVMEKLPESKLGQDLLENKYGSAPSASKGAAAAAPSPRRAMTEREKSLAEQNMKLAKKIVEVRAEHGDVTFDDANPERAKRRLSEALEYAKSRGNTNLVDKLTSAKVLPSGAFQRKEDKKRVNTDAALKDYVAEKEIEAGRGKIQDAIQAKIDSGAIKEGKYTHRDDSGTYSLTVAPSVNAAAYDSLDDETKAAISSPKASYSMELARKKLSAEQLEAVSNKQQVMDFVVGKKPEIDGVPTPNTKLTGKSSEEVAASGLSNLSDYTQSVEKQFGSKKERGDRKSENAEIIKSAVADRGQNTFVPGRAYANGALLSTRTVLSKKDLEEQLTPAQLRSITETSSQLDPVKAKAVLSNEQYSAIFEHQTASLRVTPKRAAKK